MASYDAEINLIVSGFRQIRELEDRLNGIQNTIEEINDLGANAVMGRVTDMNSYSRVLKYLESSKAAMAGQVAEQQRVNATTRQQLLLYSQLNQEQSRFRRRSSAFTEESRGVRETNSRVIELTTQLRSAQRAFSQLFAEADIQGVRTINSEISSLLEELREINRVATGVKNVGANTGQLQAQADRWQMEVRALRQRASLLSENEEILARLLTAERNLIELRNADMTFREDANVRLGRQELANAAFLIKTEEDLANRRRRDASDYERQLQKQTQAIQQQAKQFGSLLKEAGKASSAIFNAVTFDRGPQIAKGAKNAAIRGGVGLGALGLGSAYMATQQALGNIDLGALSGPVGAAAKTVGSAINSALGGVPAIIGEMLSALGHIPSSLGLASVAALAFAPAMKTAADAVFLAGKKFGETKFGENIKLTLDRQTNIFESIINKASEMNIALDASKSGLDAIGTAVKTLPALPAAGQTAFRGEFRKGRSGAFIGGGARDILANPDYLIGATGVMAQRTKDAAETSLRFAEGLGQAAGEAKTVADYLAEAVKIQKITETPAKRFVRQTIELGRAKLENQRSAEIVRERSTMLLGGSYSLSQVPARGELFPGGRTETAQPAYREMLNNAARVSQLQQEILDQMSKQQGFAATIGQLERRTINDKGRSLSIQEQENTELEKSIQIIRERNKELRQRPIAQMTPEERVSQGILDPGSLRAQRRRRVEIGRLDPLERFYAGFQPRKQAARSARATSEGLIGGAFPLLFGQGVGASVGGGLGGALGGFAGGGLGFGLSLIGTAVGQAIDTFISNIKALGQSLKDPTASLEAMKTAGLAVSDSLEYNVKKLQDAGKAYEAQGLVFAELKKQLGPDAVKQVQALTAEQKQLDQEWQQLTSTLTSKLLPIATGFIAVVNDIANAIKVVASIKLPPWVQETIDIGIPGMKSVKNIAGVFAARGKSEAAKQSGAPGLTQEGIVAQGSAAGATDELRAQVQLASQQLTLAGMTAEKDGARYASLARAVAIQEYENKLLEIKNSWIGQVFDKEKYLLQIRAAQLERSMKIKNINLEMINAQAKQGEDAENKRIEALKTINSLYVELNNLSLEKQDLENEITGFLDGETAKLERQLKLMDDTLKYKEANLLFEAQTALQGAKTAEEQRLLNEIYSKRMNILQRQESLEAERVRRRLKEVELEKQLAVDARADETASLRRSLREQQAKTAIGISSFFAMPGETDAANLALEQRTRRAEGELEIMGKIRDITAEINSGSLNKEALATKQLDLQAQQQKLGALYEELTVLEQLENQQLKLQKFFASYGQLITGISDQIANSVTFGISEITAGTKTAQQVFADFLNGVANILMQAAQQMIATYISIGIAKMFAGMGSPMNFSQAPSVDTFGAMNLPGLEGAGALGNGLGLGNGIGVPATFANGGMFTNSIVKSPTLFKFADGGALRSGVMGEAGPEAVMPLTRASDGRLGVDASGLDSAGNKVEVGQINITVENKGDQLSPAAQKQIAGQVRGIVLATLVDQKRGGGVLR